MFVAESTRCWAAAEVEFVEPLALFFLDLPGPIDRLDDDVALKGGRTGDESRDGVGELVVDEASLG